MACGQKNQTILYTCDFPTDTVNLWSQQVNVEAECLHKIDQLCPFVGSSIASREMVSEGKVENDAHFVSFVLSAIQL